MPRYLVFAAGRTELLRIGTLDKVIPAIAVYHINIPGWFLTYFWTTDYDFDYPSDLSVQNAFYNTDSTL